MRISAYGPGRPPPYHPLDGALGQATWSVGHYGEVFEAATSEAYVPRMVDREYALEDNPSAFLGSGWEEETPEAEPFEEPQGSLTNRAGSSNYRVPLIPHEQAYANHGPQEVQVTAAEGCASSVASLPPGGAHWGLQERGQEPGTSPRCTEQGDPRR